MPGEKVPLSRDYRMDTGRERGFQTCQGDGFEGDWNSHLGLGLSHLSQAEEKEKTEKPIFLKR